MMLHLLAQSGEILISRSIAKTTAGSVEKDTKTHQSRRLAIGPGSITTLIAHRQSCNARAQACGLTITDDSFLFSSALDASIPWRPDVMTNRFIRLTKELGIEKIRLHDLRHYVATSLGAAGTPIKASYSSLGKSPWMETVLQTS